ncbi:acyl-homoserine lactone acylase [Paucimonas lemoignei]|nr:acyl-homoserine lactone acylase [Paucimonas lemoignei]
MIKFKRMPQFCLAGLLCGLGVTAHAQAPSSLASAEIRRTTYGVPHIRAQNERGLGYGIGYAYAQDNLCLLANEVVTVNGQRSRYFGPEQTTLEQRNNLTSDLFFNWLNTPQDVDRFWQAQTPQVRQLVEGYVAGFNRSLDEFRQAQGAARCLQAQWLRPITTGDIVRLTRRLLAEGGAGQFAEALVGATPPVNSAAIEHSQAQAFQVAAAHMKDFALERGSNAVAIGGDRSANGRGLLLANPHFPWVGGMRFYQMHLTIPGKLDVMGASLPGLPLVNIGFNQHLAWTHTVDTSRHFTLFQLKLDPQDPTRYLLDGRSRPLEKTTVSVTVTGKDGQPQQQTREVYSSVFGPVVQWPGKLDWNHEYAYSLRDANLDNDRVWQQWYAMNHADSLAALKTSLQKIQGIPWVNTVAVDDKGQALYMNYSVVPNVSTAKLARCSDPAAGQELIVLDGSRMACAWDSDKSAAQTGIFPASSLPSLSRRDFVQNSNDSAWMTNPAQPLTGYSPLISREALPLGPRARFAVERLGTLQQSGKTSVADLQAMVMDNRVYLAESGGLLDDLLQYCAGYTGEDATTVKSVCLSLSQWDRSANLDAGPGFVHFQNIAKALQKVQGAWRIAFDSANPFHTPRGLDVHQPEVSKVLHEALLASAEQWSKAGLPDTARWGDIQVSGSGTEQTPIHGGPGTLGIYNAMQVIPRNDGKREVVSGTSYLQVVSFDQQGPQAIGLLAPSQSTEAGSTHRRDQTQAFSAKQWTVLPFTQQQIEADPAYKVQVIREQ